MFLWNILSAHGVHLSQVHPFGLMRIRHFEFVCWANNIVRKIDKFSVFYKMHRRGGWYNCASVSKRVIGTDPPHNVYEWRTKFFWLREDVVPITMVRRPANEKLPDMPVASFEGQEWFRTLMPKPTPMRAIPEEALVWAGMSHLWPYPDLEPFFQNVDESKRLPIFSCYVFLNNFLLMYVMFLLGEGSMIDAFLTT